MATDASDAQLALAKAMEKVERLDKLLQIEQQEKQAISKQLKEKDRKSASRRGSTANHAQPSAGCSSSQVEVQQLKKYLENCERQIEMLRVQNASLQNQLQVERRENAKIARGMAYNPDKLDQDDEEVFLGRNQRLRTKPSKPFQTPTKSLSALSIKAKAKPQSKQKAGFRKTSTRLANDFDSEDSEDEADVLSDITVLPRSAKPKQKAKSKAKATSKSKPKAAFRKAVDSSTSEDESDDEYEEDDTTSDMSECESAGSSPGPDLSEGNKRKRDSSEDIEDEVSGLQVDPSFTPSGPKRQRRAGKASAEDDDVDYAFDYTAICYYDDKDGKGFILSRSDVEDCDFLMERIAKVKEVWESNKGAAWMHEFQRTNYRPANPPCVSRKTAGMPTKWRPDGQGKYACRHCVKYGRPCFTWSETDEDALGWSRWEFVLLPLHDDDRTRPVVKDRTEVRYWLNDFTEYCDDDVLLSPENVEEYVD